MPNNYTATSSSVIHGLWIGNKMSALELLTIHSFLQHGFQFHLWTYQQIENIPNGCTVRDANEIIPKQAVFFYSNKNKFGHGKGSYAGFSDIFRYKLLYEYGGIWTDMDVTCIQNININTEYFFRYHHKSGAVGNFMKCPPKSELMQWCYQQASKNINENNTNWMLPIEILNDGIKRYQLENYIQAISNIDSFPIVLSLLKNKSSIPKEWKVIHWMNEEFRNLNIDKNDCLEGSFLAFQYKKYQLPHQTIKGKNKITYLLRLNRFYYLLKNIKATLNWYL